MNVTEALEWKQLAEAVAERFNRLEDKIKEVDEKLTRIEAKLDVMASRPIIVQKRDNLPP